jgi:hypothetical protein
MNKSYLISSALITSVDKPASSSTSRVNILVSKAIKKLIPKYAR